jgi:phosphoribosylformylglycinamidine synthase subunit PurS
MKFNAFINIALRKGILDVQGKTVEKALHSIEFSSITDVRIGKRVELTIEAENSDLARFQVEEACKKLIANPIIEDFSIEIKE